MRGPGEGPLPPRVLEAIVRIAVPDDPVGESIVGDMREEFRARATGGARLAAARWYARHALGVLVRVGGRRAWAGLTWIIGGGGGMDGWLHDLRFAARSFVRPAWACWERGRSPGF